MVSNCGRVARIAPPHSPKHSSTPKTCFRVMKFGHTLQGRRQVCLCMYGVMRRYLVHRLVCETFNGPSLPGQVCRHLDGNHLNNTPGNLAWGTQLENVADMFKHGTHKGAGKPKLTEAHAIEIKYSPLPQRALASAFGISQVAVHAIKAGKTWRWLD